MLSPVFVMSYLLLLSQFLFQQDHLLHSLIHLHTQFLHALALFLHQLVVTCLLYTSDAADEL